MNVDKIKKAIDKVLDNAEYRVDVHGDFVTFYITYTFVNTTQVILTFNEDGLSTIDGEISRYDIERLELEIDRM